MVKIVQIIIQERVQRLQSIGHCLWVQVLSLISCFLIFFVTCGNALNQRCILIKIFCKRDSDLLLFSLTPNNLHKLVKYCSALPQVTKNIRKQEKYFGNSIISKAFPKVKVILFLFIKYFYRRNDCILCNPFVILIKL